MGLPSCLENELERRNDAAHMLGLDFPPAKVTVEQPAPVATPQAKPEDAYARQRRRFFLSWYSIRNGRFQPTYDTVVLRGGERRWTGRIFDVFVRAFDRSGAKRALEINFKIPSKGGGDTHLSARFSPKDFSY